MAKNEYITKIEEFIVKDLARPAIIGVSLGLIFSYFTWTGVLIGGAIGGYMTRKYKVSFLVGLFVGVTSWPFVFYINQLIYGYPAVRAYTMLNTFVVMAEIIGFILALLSSLFGTSIRNILEERREKFEATRVKIPKQESKGKPTK